MQANSQAIHSTKQAKHLKAQISIKGLATVKPDNAIAPTPCPMKIESTMLYSEVAVIAMMPGNAYFMSKLRTG